MSTPVAPQKINWKEPAEIARQAGRFTEAVLYYQQGTLTGDWEAWAGLALCQEELADLAAAKASWRQVLSLRPQTAYAFYRLGWLDYREKRYAEALAHYRQAMELAPNWHEAAWHGGVCCHQMRHYAAALAFYQKALTLKPDHAAAWYHYAKALKDGGQLDAALPIYQRALALQPDNPEIHYSLGLLHLLRGEWLLGWAGYELRFQGSDRATSEHRPVTTLPLWQGESVPAGCGLIVYSEQGMGDAIQCYRYAAWLRKYFVKVKFAVHAPLVALFQWNAIAGVEIVPRVSTPLDETGYTHQMMMLSLPARLQATPQNVPGAPYLKAGPERQKRWQEKLANDPRLKIGLVWQGGKLTYAPARDMDFAYFAPLLPRQDVHWISLQKDIQPPQKVNLTDWMDEVDDFSDTAALIASLDLVIAVDTAVAHLAGAMGKKVWLLNRYESEWRWMRGYETTPWYPSMRIFSQSSPGDWAGVIRQMEAALQRCCLNLDSHDLLDFLDSKNQGNPFIP